MEDHRNLISRSNRIRLDELLSEHKSCSEKKHHEHIDNSNSQSKGLCLYHKNINYKWEGYWPLIGSGRNYDSKIIFELYANDDDDNCYKKKWSKILPTPYIHTIFNKTLFNIKLGNTDSTFDFQCNFDNLINSSLMPFIRIGTQTNKYSIELGQYVLMRDNNIFFSSSESDSQSNDVLGIIAYYETHSPSIDQFYKVSYSNKMKKNLLLSSQLFLLHINQIEYAVNLSIAKDFDTKNDSINLRLESPYNIEIKDSIIPIPTSPLSSGEENSFILIMQKIIYVNNEYFMTYASYIENIEGAIEIGILPEYNNNIEQIPIQLAIMLFFDKSIPLVDLDITSPVTEHEKMLSELYKKILKKK